MPYIFCMKNEANIVRKFPGRAYMEFSVIAILISFFYRVNSANIFSIYLSKKQQSNIQKLQGK